ncbi:MAG TPA: protein kinase [Pirellulales bacterium]
MSNSPCPADSGLEALLLGRLNEADDLRLREHLANCPACEHRAGLLLAADRLVEHVRAGMRLPEPDASVSFGLRFEPSASETPCDRDSATFIAPKASGAPDARDASSVLGASSASSGFAGDPSAEATVVRASSDRPAVSVSLNDSSSVNDFNSLNDSSSVNKPGELGRVGGFRILSVLGQGGMGVVFLAEDTHLQRLIALKAMKAGERDAAATARFLREARAAAKFQHPNLATIFAVGEAGETPYISMELLKGPDLDQRVRSRGPLPARDAAEVIRHAARGLRHAHSRGVIHRDVKPSNLMYGEEGVVKVLDLGVARISSASLDDQRTPSEATQKGMLVGTLNYMAPEQALDPTAVDERADVFALGGVLHFLLTGAPPYPGLSRAHVLESEARAPLTSPRNCPPALFDVMTKMLAVQPSKRYRNMDAVIADLDRWLDHPPETKLDRKAAEPVVVGSVGEQGNRLKQVGALVGIVAAFVLAGVLIATRNDRPKLGSVDQGDALLSAAVASPTAVASSPHGTRPAASSDAPDQVVETMPNVSPVATVSPPGTWPVGPSTGVMVGVLPRPTALSDGRRWQLIGAAPDGSVIDVDWHPSDRRVAVASDMSLRIYDADTLEVLAYALSPDLDIFTSIEWSRDGARIVSGTGVGQVTVWSDDLTPLWSRKVGGLEGAYAWSFISTASDGRILAPVNDDDSVQVYEANGDVGPVLSAKDEGLRGASASPDGAFYATGSLKGRVRIWSRDGAVVNEFAVAPDAPVAVAEWSPTGEWIAVVVPNTTDASVQLWKPNGERGPSVSYPKPARFEWRPDGRGCAVSGGGGLRQFLLENDAAISDGVDYEHARCVAFAPSGGDFATAAVTQIDVRDRTGRRLRERVGQIATELAWSPAGNYIATGSDRQNVCVWHADGRPKSHAPGPLFTKLAWSRDDRYLAYGVLGRDGAVVWRSDGAPEPQWAEHAEITEGPSWTSSHRLTVDLNYKLELWRGANALDRVLVSWPRTDYKPGALSTDWTADDELIAIATRSGRLEIRTSEGELKFSKVVAPDEGLFRVAWSHSGRTLASMRGAAVSLWTREGELIREIKTKNGPFDAMTWTHDDAYIVTCGTPGTVRVWSVVDGQSVAHWSRHRYYVRGVAADPLGPRIASLEPSGALFVHDLKTGEVEWVGLSTQTGQIVLTPAGQIVAGSPELIDRETLCVVEEPSRRLEVVKPSEFVARVSADQEAGRRVPTQPAKQP